MLEAWLLKAGWRGIQRWKWIAGIFALALAAVLFVKIATNWFDSALDVAEHKGAADAIIRGQNQTLDQLGDANEAEQTIRSSERSAERYAGCLRDARDTSQCERYNPDTGQ